MNAQVKHYTLKLVQKFRSICQYLKPLSKFCCYSHEAYQNFVKKLRKNPDLEGMRNELSLKSGSNRNKNISHLVPLSMLMRFHKFCFSSDSATTEKRRRVSMACKYLH